MDGLIEHKVIGSAPKHFQYELSCLTQRRVLCSPDAHTRIHARAHTDRVTHTHPYTQGHTRTHPYTQGHTRTRTHTYTGSRTYTGSYTHTRARARAHTHTNVRTHRIVDLDVVSAQDLDGWPGTRGFAFPTLPGPNQDLAAEELVGFLLERLREVNTRTRTHTHARARRDTPTHTHPRARARTRTRTRTYTQRYSTYTQRYPLTHSHTRTPTRAH